ncbi:4-phosphopantetheinyl transferase [Flavobacterium sp. ALD4]|jgi:4'-phosphopantetheinyl transferase|uniref:4'-phosphopantetheinyl transferase family protein n=1 Tax=Flavobacterium sp. ALD4 TaxID=2058314 RepID=UPI000C34D750|nr:4'-phosphopantetheinyl transferase superfamily protein [Flavobacterium sp. ALD4]PKH66458.1 4-phosphopantetheinyl transferase [Flavobacterium sp. ALD4]
MPLYKTIRFSSTTQIFVWKITESFEQLNNEVQLNEKNCIRLEGMKSEIHQRGFLSVRKLLQTAGYTDFDLYYDELGKPHLKDDKYISITHSHNFSAIIVSNKTVGIDVELQRDKIIRIADKFVDVESSYLNQSDLSSYIKKLTIIWGAKEAIFKIRNEKGISFKEHIKVSAFEMEDTVAAAELHYDTIIRDFTIYFEEIENFILVHACEKQ